MISITSASKMKFVFFVCSFIISIFNIGWAGNGPDFNRVLLSAENGDLESQYLLGELYQYGEGVKRIKSIHYDGKPVQENFKEAAKWYLKAANQGHIYAPFHLGCLYEAGKGVQQSNIEAIKWYQKAANHGHKPSQDRMKWVMRLERGTLIRTLQSTINKTITTLDLDVNTTSFVEIGEDKRASIRSILSGLFDFHEFSRCALGNRYWNQFTSEQQQSFLILHQKLLENGFIKFIV
ncbi:hypothetical protein DSCO28_02220 [Desulfosarcina ovata subsp. sediminis]|uniref:Sel1 repeat family protein n=1 Tax=Desulfosarcina ovata subsp. sediminis TaxID=885957 RepID=A0A5K7ZFC3_9BACT|nr:ABC transporter substrate-binding protein [Desulfosarcina ovata]BBO79656.1 hypothetical protein DSCO28_02220 [Desulfosarcina ovata subsp. sediminis]